jgi:hypothetical protein
MASPIFIKSTNNVYTALALISMLSVLVALVYAYMRLRDLGATPF